ncbi:MAG: radical SAM protein [Chlorobiaceae bacterium]
MYNALSNTLLELEDAHYNALENLRNGKSKSGSIIKGDFLALLRKNNMVIEKGEEEQLLLARQYQRHAVCFDTSRLGLTICPTLLCNFRCLYCFEHSQADSSVMTPETIDRLIHFIKRYKDIKHLSIAWYGGEPLLAFDVICDITAKVMALDLDIDEFGMVTNGYLLDSKKIARLNDLNIKTIQITLDGPEEVHDTRRVLAGGGPTFQRIIKNIDALMNSDYKGSCAIRVNIDKTNQKQFIAMQIALLERYKGKKLTVYAGHVNTSNGHPFEQSCSLNLQEWTDFTFEQHQGKSHAPTANFYPSGNLDSVCVATSHQGFVVGPEGELYQCWEDVGTPVMVVGNIHEEEPITNPVLHARYSIGTDAYNDPDCRECNVLPICGGGCANKRMRAKQFGEKGLEFCSPYKDNLTTFLEAYIDTFRSREICEAVLSPKSARANELGYRLISPEKKKAGEEIKPGITATTEV